LGCGRPIFLGSSASLNIPSTSIRWTPWAASLGEGTQDVQKLIIFRELMKKKESSTDEVAGKVRLKCIGDN